MSFVWPFTHKEVPGQFERVDEGWDIQAEPGADILAIAAGTVHSVNRDPGGFGNDYWSLELDDWQGGPSNWVYNGHCHLDLPDGTHVTQGQVCGHANRTNGFITPENGSEAPPGWLEIGFAVPGTGSPINRGSGDTPAGHAMQDLLINAPVFGGASSQRKAARDMTIQDNESGKIWLLGAGKAVWCSSLDQVNELHYVGVSNAGASAPLVVIHWMKNFGAW